MEPDEFGGLLPRRSFVGAAAAAAAAACAFLVRAGRAHSAEPAGSVEDIRGEAFAEASRARRSLERQAPLFIADRVGTGPASRLTIHLGQLTRVRLGEQTRVTIDRYLVDAGGEFTLESGALLFDRQAGAKPSPVRIRSSFGLIAVRGTRFFAGPSGSVFGVFVQRGTVVVRAARREVILREGQGTDIPRPGSAPTPPKAWGEPRIRAALASVF